MITVSSPSVVPSPRLLPPTTALPDGTLNPALNYTWAGVVCFIVFIIYATRRNKYYDTIPAIGRTGLLTSYLDAMQFLKYGNEFVMEGYAKYRSGIFRVPDLKRWHILVSGPKLTDELRKAPDDVLSFHEAIKEIQSTEWILGPELHDEPYTIPVVRNHLTRNLGNLFSDLREETVLAFEENIPPTEEWTKVRALGKMMTIISRASNRIFVGAPTCRDPEYTALNVQFTVDVMIGSRRLRNFPNFLKPIAGRFLTTLPRSMKVALKHLSPIIEERRQKIEEYGTDYPDKPVDMLSWLMDDAPDDERTTERLTQRILGLNFAAIHTTSITFTTALYQLAFRSEYLEPIREEVEAVIAQYGWNKAAINRMRKLDSFMKETQRIEGLGAASMIRKALKGFMFSDGTHIPKGALVSAAARPRHLDDDIYPDGSTFKGFRFSDLREEEGEGTKNQMVATSVDYIAFGHGKHACPGRFFAVNEIKTMMAHVVLTYDIKMTELPRSTWSGMTRVPDQNAEVLFRKRRL